MVDARSCVFLWLNSCSSCCFCCLLQVIETAQGDVNLIFSQQVRALRWNRIKGGCTPWSP